MKKHLIFILMAVSAFGADAANDLILSQRKADNSGNIQRNVAPTANGFLTFNSSKVPTSPDLTYSSPTLTFPASGVITGAGAMSITAGGTNESITLTPSGTGGLGIGVAGSTGQRIKLYGTSVVTTPVEATWWTSANPGLFGGFSEGTGAGAGDWIFAHASASVNGTNQIYRKARGTLAAPAAVNGDDAAGGFIGSFYDGGAFRNTASVQFAAESNATSGNAPGRIVFSTGLTTGRQAVGFFNGNGSFELGITGRSIPAWTTSGIFLRTSPGQTWTDTTSSGTVANVVGTSLGSWTVAANSATTYTDAATLRVAGPTAGSNATFTNNYSIVSLGNTRLDGAVVIPSSNTAGLQLYNTADQVTNYERLEELFSANTAIIRTNSAGTGQARPLRIGAGTSTSGVTFNASGTMTFQGTVTTAAGVTNVSFSGTGSNATSGTNVGLSLTPTYNQASGSAANTDLLVNRTETSVGSGSQYLADFQVGGATKFNVDNVGIATITRVSGSPTLTLSRTTTNAGSAVISAGNNGTLTLNAGGTGSADYITLAPTSTNAAASGTVSVVRITPTYNQSASTAANTDLLINRTETAVGSGTQLLIQAQTGGSDRFVVSNSGNVGSNGQLRVGGTTFVNSRFSIATVSTGFASWTTNGALMRVEAATITDTSTAPSGTAASAVFTSFAQPTLAATNSSVTTNLASTVYIANAPAAGTNMTISDAAALQVAGGTVLFQTGLRTRRVISVRTSSATEGTDNSWNVTTNEGATSRVDRTLPATAAGLTFTFYVQDADGLRIIAPNGSTIRVGASVTSSGGSITSTTIGDCVTLVAINSTQWVAVADVGSAWTFL